MNSTQLGGMSGLFATELIAEPTRGSITVPAPSAPHPMTAAVRNPTAVTAKRTDQCYGGVGLTWLNCQK